MANTTETKAAEATMADRDDAMAEKIGAAIGKAMAGSGADSGFDASQPEADPEVRLDYAPNGGIYKLDEDSPLVNSWGEEVDAEGNVIKEKKRTRRG